MSSQIYRLTRHFCTQITAPKPTTTNADIKNLFKESDLTKVVSNFKQYSDTRSFRGRHNIYERTITRLASANQHPLIEDILEHQKNYEDIKREGFAIRLITLYGKAGMPQHAHKLFDEMPQRECDRTAKSLNALLNAYAQSKKFDDVVKLFRELTLSTLIKPDERAFNVVIRALCEKGEFDSAEKMLGEMESNGVKPSVNTFNVLMNGFYSNGKFEDGARVWAEMEKTGVQPDVVSFNGKIKGLILAGNISDAINLLEELKTREIKPDVITYNTLVKGYCQAGDLDVAKELYDRLMKSDCDPNRATYQALIPCICEKGDSDFALKLCKESLIESCYISVDIIQNVVNLLVKDSKVEEAKELLKIAYSRKYKRSQLKIPAPEE